MDRRRILTSLAGSVVGASMLCRSASAEEHAQGLKEWFHVSLGKEIQLGTRSAPVGKGDSKFSIVGLGKCRLDLSADNRLSAQIKASVVQYARVDYWVSLAVFDERRNFLGAATRKVEVQYVRSGAIPTLFSELDLDFGVSQSYQRVKRLAVAISEPDTPQPG